MKSSNNYNNGWSSLIQRRRDLRKTMTKSERLLWKRIRAKRIEGLQFRRQHGINNFIVDFCHEKSRTVIEVDGGIHFSIETKEHDSWRSGILESWGYSVIRFSNIEVYTDTPLVIKKILKHIQEKSQPSPPSRAL